MATMGYKPQEQHITLVNLLSAYDTHLLGDGLRIVSNALEGLQSGKYTRSTRAPNLR